METTNYDEKQQKTKSQIPACDKQVLAHHHERNLENGITLVLSSWDGLQVAIQNQWGGSDSRQKSHQLAADICSWLSKSKGSIQVDDLENRLHEYMLLTFNTEMEDGSIEEVAEQLMMIHEEYLQGVPQSSC